ncbi:MAG TPA: DUF1592 domain-containing protein [Nannocystaceae bacterium]|nr:DUF1592 domain-containing protein [Nannocystaceae bacterium]
MRARTKMRTLGLGLTAGMLSAFTLNACQETTDAEEQCQSNEDFFKEKVWTNTLAVKCIKCHTDTGQAKDSKFILRDAAWGPNYMENNLEVFTSLAKLEYEGTPWILLKPSMQIDHEGLMQIEKGGEEYKAFQEMIDRLANPVACEDDGSAEQEFFAGVELLDEVATLRKASLSIVGRVPTLEEEQEVRDGGFEALDSVLDGMMTEQAFFDRLIEVYNDHFLTDRYYDRGGGGQTPALDLLENQEVGEDDQAQPVYPNVRWYDSLPEGEMEIAAQASNNAVARESLELIAHVVRNELPFTEILTADYTMVNSYSAKVYGLDNVNFEDAGDYNEFVPAKVPGVPHTGVLTTTVFLNRFPTTDTNRNRHRSRMFYKFFLATDVLLLGERPVQSSAILSVAPWLNEPSCIVCHSIVDPVAGTFQNYMPENLTRYEPPVNGWFGDMAAPGYGETAMPAEQATNALSWMTAQAVQDRRFALSAVHIVWKGLSGDDPIQPPRDPHEEGYLEGIRAADMQTKIFDEVVQKFIDSGYNLKVIVKELVKTPYYRAYNASGLDESRTLELAQLGTGRLLIPEQLHRKIEAVTGQPWRSQDQPDYLLDMDRYRIFYGGIDSDTVVERITEPNGIMANVAKRMSNEIACWTTAIDFTRDPGDRNLFPFVDPTFKPEDMNGFEVPAAASAIRANIQYLHAKLLGEYLDQNSPEINRTYELFLNVWKEGQRGTKAVNAETMMPEYGSALPGPCQATTDFWTGAELGERAITEDPNYTIRAWMAVMSYLLSDYRFLHE